MCSTTVVLRSHHCTGDVFALLQSIFTMAVAQLPPPITAIDLFKFLRF